MAITIRAWYETSYHALSFLDGSHLFISTKNADSKSPRSVVFEATPVGVAFRKGRGEEGRMAEKPGPPTGPPTRA